MLKQSPCRVQRSKSFKVKHAIHVVLLLAICIWLLYQVKHSHERNKAHEESSGKISEKKQTGHETIKLGRKDLHPQLEETDLGTERKEELEQEIEDSKQEETEDEVRGGEDDEIDGHHQERVEEEEPEEVEDLIDVDDREREAGIDELDGEGNENQIEDVSFSDDQDQIEVERNTQEAREENYKGDDASSAVVQNTRTISNEFEVGGLRKVKEQEDENEEKIEVEQDNETDSTLEVAVNLKNPVPQVENGAFGDAARGEEEDSGSGLVNSEPGSNTTVSKGEAYMKLKVRSNPTSIQDINITSNATNGETGVLSGSRSVIPKRTANLYASTLSEESSAAKTMEESDNTADRKSKEGSASMTTNESKDVVENESFDSSESKFYQEDGDSEKILELLAENENNMENGEDAAER